MSFQPPVDPSRLLEQDPLLEALHEFQLDTLIQESRNEPLEPLVYIRTIDNVNRAIQLFKVHNVISLPVFDPAEEKFIAIVNVVHIVKFIMLREVFYKHGVTLSPDVGVEMVEQIKEELRPIYDLPISDVVAAANVHDNFKMYHKSVPLIDTVRALMLKENAYAILCSVSDDKEKMLGDIQHASIITQWDVMTFFIKNEKLKVHGIGGLPAQKAIQRSWITFTRKEDPNQPSHRLPVSETRRTFALSITEDMTAFAGFKLLAVHGISSVAVVDRESEPVKLTDNLSASDIKYVSPENIDGYNLVSEFLHKVSDHPRRVVSCYEETSLEEVTRLAIAAGVHRVWITEKDTEKPLGVVTMSDMLSMFIGVKGERD
ncbi:3391_t:CDS:2 [Acaulospora morrowiae]|uniref:3391_t:CDS:1 n=1 Tax=Acaulospora morrowiae TaxID=94023 RepID=A0A9N9G656_9GLOM|nr:3391_t:CDS:2 [Acaulospora morrowiae]